MRKGAAVGSGSSSERQPTLDPRFPGPPLRPLAAPCSIGLEALGQPPVLRGRRGIGAWVPGAWSVAAPGRMLGRAMPTRDLSRH
uniref:Uncharacterized protein n=1 Tax=Arundo donax TaxID=35708 RepID=A0A0A9CIP4_ARUDO